MILENRQSAAKPLLNEEGSTTIPEGSTGSNTGKRPRVRNVIYKITTKTNNKIYIGSASYYDKRIGTHISRLRKNEHDNIHLQNAYNKYGEEDFVFEILEHVEQKEKLLEREQYYMDIHNVCDPKIGYNISKKAESRIGCKMSCEAKKKIGDFWRGKKHSVERIENRRKYALENYAKKVTAHYKDGSYKTFNSITEASKETGLSIACISKQCSSLGSGRKITFRFLTQDIV